MSLSQEGGGGTLSGGREQHKPPWQTGSSLRQMATSPSLPAPQLSSAYEAGGPAQL